MFDLPCTESKERKEYTIFHKELIKNGYTMIQYSIYSKIINFKENTDSEIDKLKRKLPNDGNIRVLVITDKQYSDMRVILGNKNINEIYNSSERYVKI